MRQQRTLVLLLGLAVLLAGMGRLWSMRVVGLPEPASVWIGYLVPEFLVALLMIAAQLSPTGRSRANRAVHASLAGLPSSGADGRLRGHDVSGRG